MRVHRFRLLTKLPASAVIERLRSNVSVPPSLGQKLEAAFRQPPDAGLPFVGKVSSDSFVLREDTPRRDSLLPQIRGQVRSGSSGTEIVVTLHLHLSAILVAMAVLVVLGIDAILSVVRGASLLSGRVVFASLAICGLVIGAKVGFQSSADKVRRLLEQVLDARAA